MRAWAGGEIAPGAVDTAPAEPATARVAFRPARVNHLLGTDLSADEQRGLLARVGMATEPAGADEPVTIALRPEPLVIAPEPGTAIAAVIPTWRRDIAVEADVAEEIARVRGYELIPSVTPDTMMPRYRPSPLEVRDLVRETLAGAGLTEVVTTALVSPRHIETFVLAREVPSVGDEDQPGGDPIGVGNPLSRDHSLLRRNLLGSLLDVVAVNLRHGTEDVAVFEIGKGYARTGEHAARVVAPRLRAGRCRGARGVEPRRAALRPRRREGRPGAPGPPARARPPRLRGRDGGGHLPPRPDRPGRDRRAASTRSSASCTPTWSTPGSCAPPAG